MPCLCELASDAEYKINETEINMNGQNKPSFFSVMLAYALSWIDSVVAALK